MFPKFFKVYISNLLKSKCLFFSPTKSCHILTEIQTKAKTVSKKSVKY